MCTSRNNSQQINSIYKFKKAQPSLPLFGWISLMFSPSWLSAISSNQAKSPRLSLIVHLACTLKQLKHKRLPSSSGYSVGGGENETRPFGTGYFSRCSCKELFKETPAPRSLKKITNLIRWRILKISYHSEGPAYCLDLPGLSGRSAGEETIW